MKLYKVLTIFAVILAVALFLGFSFNKNKYSADVLKNNYNTPQVYYKIFNSSEFITEQEKTPEELIQKLDIRLNKYRREFSQIAGTNDNQKLRALFMMNFIQMYGYYYKRDVPADTDFKHLMWNTKANNCGSNTIILSMLLKASDYEFRTVSINKGNHGYVEVKFKDGWQILDPTTNLWIRASTEEQISGKVPVIKQFFLKADDINNLEARKHMERGLSVIDLRNNMLKIGRGFNVTIDKYDYIDFSTFKY